MHKELIIKGIGLIFSLLNQMKKEYEKETIRIALKRKPLRERKDPNITCVPCRPVVK